eukprot:jgi/Hompol1/1124/HPOL_000044-RA
MEVLALLRFCDGTNVCVTGGKDPQDNLVITVQSSSNGWAGFGIGSQMAGATMYLAWKNSTGGIVLSPRHGTGHVTPQSDPSSPATLIATPSYVTPQPWANIVFSFKRPVTTNTFHEVYGVINNFDLTTPAPIENNNGTQTPGGNGTQPSPGNIPVVDGGSGGAQGTPILKLPDGVTYDYILRIHGYLLFFAWTISPAIGIFIARYLKDYLGVWWFRLHVFF